MSYLIRDITLKRTRIRVASIGDSFDSPVIIPIRIKREMKTGILPKFCKKLGLLVFISLIVISQVGAFSAFEAHIINVTAHICEPLEIRSMGYWMNHSNVYRPYLPQYLGEEEIDTVAKAQEVFSATPFPPPTNVQRIMLKKHLLAMKFNLAHFGIGGHLVEGEEKTLNQIVAEADALLLDPNAGKDDLEAMKDLLDKLNAADEIRYCYVYLPKLEVIVPNGGEEWWVGQYYNITWTSGDLECADDASEVSIWYSADSGESWANIVQGADNDGTYNWRVPLFLSGYYVPSDKARIKIVARCSENQIIVTWDMSDEDFCPPIDYASLTGEEKAQVEYLLFLGILTEEDIINREIDLSGTDIIETGDEQTGVFEEEDGDDLFTDKEGEEENLDEEILDEEILDEEILDEEILDEEIMGDETPDEKTLGEQVPDEEEDKDLEKELEDEELTVEDETFTREELEKESENKEEEQTAEKIINKEEVPGSKPDPELEPAE